MSTHKRSARSRVTGVVAALALAVSSAACGAPHDAASTVETDQTVTMAIGAPAVSHANSATVSRAATQHVTKRKPAPKKKATKKATKKKVAKKKAPAKKTTKPVTPGAFCSKAKAKGKTKTGKVMVCSKTKKDPRLRWRAA